MKIKQICSEPNYELWLSQRELDLISVVLNNIPYEVMEREGFSRNEVLNAHASVVVFSQY